MKISPDSKIQLLDDVKFLSDAPSVEDVCGDPGEHLGQLLDPLRLIRTSTASPDKTVGQGVMTAWK